MGVDARCVMTWEGSKRRWRKMYRGSIYTVSCEHLNVPATKEASYQAANAWWRLKVASLASPTSPSPFQSEITRLEARKQWASRHAPSEVSQLSTHLTALQSTPAHAELPDADEAAVSEGIRTAELFGIQVPDDIDFEVANHFFGEKKRWQGRLETDQTESVPQNQSIGFHGDAWIGRQGVKVSTNEITPGRFDNVRRNINGFLNFAGRETAIHSINEAMTDSYYQHVITKIQGKAWTPDTGKSVWGTFRTFVRWAYSRRLIELPRNLDQGIKVSPKAIKPMGDDDFRTMFTHATGQLKLHLLLMLNCGMRSADIADLQDFEVDWTAGRIIRQRSKTRKHNPKQVPYVNYRLWDETFALLRQYRSGKETVLLTKSGGLWAWEEKIVDKVRQADNIATNYNRLRKKLKVATPLSSIRKQGASKLNAHAHYGRYRSHYLGESPRGITDAHYAAPSIPLFDEILAWLGDQMGFTTSR